ncbi:MAG: LTA synthase family protein [Faecousia sp.]
MKKQRPTRKRKGLAAAIIGFVLLLLGFLCYYSARWYQSLYGSLSFNAILFTLLSGLSGVEQSILDSFFRQALVLTLLTAAVLTLFFTNPSRFHLRLVLRGRKITLSPIRPRLFLTLSALACCLLVYQAAEIVGLPQWLAGVGDFSRLIQEEYVPAEETSITFPEKKRNLIYIYLESMEATFCSVEQGGSMPECLIPELYDLAQENTYFSDTDGMGGWGEVSGTTWTTAGMVAQVGGLPLLLPFGGNRADHMSRPLASATLLWDILDQQGYYQAVMMGSYRNFSDQVSLMEQHGIDVIYDRITAAEDGLVPPDYLAWWGIEDIKLFDYARQKLTEIAAQEQPFQFTLITIDTHMPDGYLCTECPDKFPEQYENVIACSSAQVASFVAWLQEQPFYDDTTVILCGDHLSMAGAYFQRNGLDDIRRRVYNCIINSPVQTDNTHNRVFSPLDMFPTTLAAMGCQIEGDRLGLGVNLYSDVPTLAERMGVDQLNQELNRSSLPYLLRFLLEPGQGQWLTKLVPGMDSQN